MNQYARIKLQENCHNVFSRFEGREVALVLGATGDVGRAFVQELVKRQLFVVAVARDNERLKGLKHEICGAHRERYHGFGYVSVDLSDVDVCAVFAEMCQRSVPRIRYVVFAAGGLKADGEFTHMLENLRWHMNANLLTRLVPYDALRRAHLVVPSTVLLVVGSACYNWPDNDPRIDREVGYAASMRCVADWFGSVSKNQRPGHAYHLPYPLMEGVIAKHLKECGLVPDDVVLPKPSDLVVQTIRDLEGLHLFPV